MRPYHVLTFENSSSRRSPSRRFNSLFLFFLSISFHDFFEFPSKISTNRSNRCGRFAIVSLEFFDIVSDIRFHMM